MNEEQLADLLAQHLDTLLEGGSLPEALPPEVADLLTVAQSLSEAAPRPRPEFGTALKESLLGPIGGGNGAAPSAGPVFGGQMAPVVVVGLLIGAAILGLLASVVIYSGAGANLSGSSTPAPLQTQINPAQLTPSPLAPAQTAEPTVTGQATAPGIAPAITATPIIDVLPVITVTIEIIIEPPVLAPGPSGGGDSGDGGAGGGGDGGDHDRGHGNDSDHHDEDNPGRGGGD